MSNYSTYNFDYDYSMNSQSSNYDFGNIAATTAGTILSGNGLNGVSWGSLSINTSTTSYPVTMNQGGRIECTGENADLVINGKSIKSTLEAIEQRLAILRPDTKLESEWNELKELGDRYRTLEAEIREKMRVWDILKSDGSST